LAIFTNIRQRQIYWLNDCEPLDEDQEKDRPIIVLDSPSHLRTAGIIRVVACSTHPRKRDMQRILIPNRHVVPGTGLPKDCWAIPRWYLNINRFRLTDLKGTCPEQLFVKVLLAVEKQIATDEAEGT
jgi:mRNA-degrading endonuclease toxin of MazEF toxin-antitoxin module